MSIGKTKHFVRMKMSNAQTHIESSNTAIENTRSGINAFVRGPSNPVISSRKLKWNGICLEMHHASAAERAESQSAAHLITLFTTQVLHGESSTSQGRFVRFAYHPGAINLYPSGTIPACRTFTETKIIVCALDREFMNDVGEELDLPPTKQFHSETNLRDPSLKSIIMLLAAEARSGGSSGKLFAEHLAHALALRFLSLTTRTPSLIPSRNQTQPCRALRRVLERMEAELAEKLHLHTLAAECGYSRSHFLRMFYTSMGCSPHQWLIRLRVERAKKLLRQSSAPLIDIATDCGFSSHAHLSKSFLQVVGIAPSQYRRTPDLFM
jgi:AraC family transcriptional regulator